MKLATFPFRLAVFPVLQALSFTACILLYEASPVISLSMLALSALCLNFSVHIFFHECVHRSGSYPAIFNFLASVFIGLPFDGYRIHHYNHHRHENGERDLSTTWNYTGKNRIARSALSYALGWPRQIIDSLNRFRVYDDASDNIAFFQRRISIQKRFLQLGLLLTAIFSWKIAIAYVLMIYFGWVFTAMQNYGQHPPVGEDKARTFTNPLYNLLFFNNGLHWEHHNNPSLQWHELKESNNSKRIHCAHLLNPIFNTGEEQ